MECKKCKRSYTQGGECRQLVHNCLYYEEDERGTLTKGKFSYPHKFDDERKNLKIGDEIIVKGNLKETAAITVKKIIDIGWSYGKYGIDGVNIVFEGTYFCNEYTPKYDPKTKFTVVK